MRRIIGGLSVPLRTGKRDVYVCVWMRIKDIAHLCTLAGRGLERHCLEPVITEWGCLQSNGLQHTSSE
jgi:hypothetical protein